MVSDGAVYAFVVDMMVDPNHRLNGVGQVLLKFLIDDLRTSGLRVLQLISSKEGARLYKKSGFKMCADDAPGMTMFL